jgi:hypothetical protein
MCTAPQMANAHSIGCRVMPYTPRASVVAALALPGMAGLRTIDPSSMTEANSISTVASAQMPSPTFHSGAVAGVRG